MSVTVDIEIPDIIYPEISLCCLLRVKFHKLHPVVGYCRNEGNVMRLLHSILHPDAQHEFHALHPALLLPRAATLFRNSLLQPLLLSALDIKLAFAHISCAIFVLNIGP